KFAGEIDVLEALDDVRSRYRIDDERTSVRGFSMGGAACWQFATHYADRWFAANPGAGFSETPRFLDVFQKETLNPQPWEKTLWNLYDCDKWSGNLLHCPTVAYSGENDPQKQAADVMEEALAERGMRLRHLIGPGMGHTYDPVSAAAVDAALADLAITGRPRSVPLIHLTTYSLRYNRMRSATIDGLTEHWKPAELRVSCELQTSDRGPVLRVSARNINAFRLNFKSGELPLSAAVLQNLLGNKPRPIQVSIASPDSDRAPQWLPLQGPFSDGGFELQVHQRENGQWHAGPKPAGLRKTHGLQGPIDDAFMDSFVFVRPTGKAAHDAVGKWANAELERAVEHWRRHFRGDARVVDDTDVTPEMISDCNLVLWGDPYSNSVLGKIGARLPIQWDDTAVSAGTQSWDASGHALIMIAPNPLNPDRYVVLNSSFTFRDYAYLNNARQVPMLPDWAVIDLSTAPGNVWPGKVAPADLFNEEWITARIDRSSPPCPPENLMRVTESLLATFLLLLPVTQCKAADEAAGLGILKRFTEEFVAITPGNGFPARGIVLGTADPKQELPKITVEFRHSFRMSRYEVTQELYELVMGENPSRWKGPRNSVEMMTLAEAQEFCAKLTVLLRQKDLLAADHNVRLP
ncbi:MAG: prolyl oligopeptidase family serine peptidase, partial [Planctomycetaceae bacterium]